MENGPDRYDRQIGALHGLPDALSTKSSTIEIQTPMVGNAETFIVQTYRQKDIGDTIFLKHIAGDRTIRIAIPPDVADAIARQRDSLTGRMRSKAAKANAQARKDRGELPGFMKGKKAARKS